ncbi:MAG TPA: ACT domain-containing protein, partial [Lacunisphaera sp.]|nr:ACT domain-containing protein [Lacunisphaera sp.]
MSNSEPARLRLIASCPDRIGIVARVATFLAEHGASITEASQYDDPRSQTFFMRSEFVIPGGAETRTWLEAGFRPIARELGMTWRLADAHRRQRVVMLVSKFDHCLAYLLHRRKVGDLNLDVPCVISNHEDLRSLVEWYGIPYHHVPVPADPAGKQAALEETA